MRRTLISALALLAAACAGPGALRHGGEPVRVGIIALNDFHGALEPPGLAVAAPDGTGGTMLVPAGGAAWLASAIDLLKGKYASSVVVAAGDMTGASQLASSIYLDEAAVGVLNRLGLEFTAVGNHEFDRGREELLRLQNGGCAKLTLREPCQIEPFAGARYRYLAASTLTEDGTPLFAATGTKSFGTGARKVTVGFIGLTLKGTPNLVTPDGIRGLTFGDEAEAINAAVPVLKQQGADAVVVLLHQGAEPSGAPDPDGCEGIGGAVLPILARLDPRVDVVVSGHTHKAYVCDYATSDPSRPILLTSAGYYGQLVTDITLEIDPVSDHVVARSADNLIVQSPAFTGAKGTVENTPIYPAFAPRADVANFVQRYVDAASAFTSRPVGRLSGPAERAEGSGGTIGNLITDGQVAATRTAGAVIAFTNPYGLRAPIVPGPDGGVTFAQLYAVQPFNGQLITQTMTGAQIKAVIEEGLDDDGTRQLLAPSSALRFGFDMTRQAGDRVTDLTFDGKPVDPAASYRVTVNSFLAGGGDGFSVFTQGTDKVTGATDLEATEAWLAAVPLRQVPQEERAVAAAR